MAQSPQPPDSPPHPGASKAGPAALSSSFWIGSRLGKYLLTAKLGSGGMGIVYEAQDPLLKRPVAIKLLTDSVAAQPDILQRFLQEARAAARLNHPNVVAIHEVDQQSGTYFLVMELLRGGSAQDFLDQQGPFDWSEATRIVADVCRGVQAAHAAGLIHRDIKPANIMRDADGVVKLADFGLAKVVTQPSSMAPVTQSGFVAGTPEYMSPEQCRADPLDERTDLYSLGATYYALLTGRAPYQADNPMQVMFAHCTAKVPNVRAANGQVPEACARIVERAMAKVPGDRYPSAAKLLTELEGALAAAPVDVQASRWTEVLPQEPVPATSGPVPAASAEALALLGPPRGSGELGRLGPYRVLRVLGEGGMGVVFQAQDPALERLVALKVMKPARGDADLSRQRFLQEAKVAASLQHENIVTIYQVGEDSGVPYLAMEFLRGEPLDVRLKRGGALPIPDVLHVAREVAAGLAAAHNHDLIHRDIKPANIWLEESGTGALRIKLLDFGLARVVREDGQNLTRTGMVMGTPGYMAPEQAKGGARLDRRCDLFSLGCVLYHATTGQEPFRRDDTMSTLMALALEDPPAIRSLKPQAPAGLVRLVTALLKKRPEERPASASAVIELVEEIEREYAVMAPALAAVGKAPRAGRAPEPRPPASERLAEAGLVPTYSTEFQAPVFDGAPGPESIDTPSGGQPRTAFLEEPPAAPATEIKPADGVCPRCGAPGLNPASRAWCLACGYYPEPEKKAEEPKPRLEWLWPMLIGMALIAVLSYAARVYLPHESYVQTWWSGSELVIGVLAILVGHLWAFFTTLPERDDHLIFHYVDFSKLWRLTFELLPNTRRPLWVGCWGGTAVLCAVFLVGGIPYLWKGLPKRMAARPTRADESAFDFSRAKNKGAGLTEEAELTSKDRDLDAASQEKRFTEVCSVIGYLQEDDGTITGLVLAAPREGNLQFAGVVKAAVDEASNAEWQKGVTKLTDPRLVRPTPFVEGMTAVRVKVFNLGSKVIWTKPDLSCTVEYAEASPDGMLSDPVFKSW